jgi:hypothetical protein
MASLKLARQRWQWTTEESSQEEVDLALQDLLAWQPLRTC